MFRQVLQPFFFFFSLNALSLYMQVLENFTCYTSVNPPKSTVHGLLNSWTCNGCSYYIIKSHNNICSNSVLCKIEGNKNEVTQGKIE